MKFICTLFAVLAFCAASTFGKTYDRCSLAKELLAMDVPKSELAIWTCIALRESSYRTDAVGPPNSDGSRDYGIFQINNKYWCQSSNGHYSHNMCKISCDSLLKANIKNSLTCARKIKKQQGWKAWATWKYCNGELPSIDNCF